MPTWKFDMIEVRAQRQTDRQTTEPRDQRSMFIRSGSESAETETPRCRTQSTVDTDDNNNGSWLQKKKHKLLRNSIVRMSYGWSGGYREFVHIGCRCTCSRRRRAHLFADYRLQQSAVQSVVGIQTCTRQRDTPPGEVHQMSTSIMHLFRRCVYGL